MKIYSSSFVIVSLVSGFLASPSLSSSDTDTDDSSHERSRKRIKKTNEDSESDYNEEESKTKSSLSSSSQDSSNEAWNNFESRIKKQKNVSLRVACQVIYLLTEKQLNFRSNITIKNIQTWGPENPYLNPMLEGQKSINRNAISRTFAVLKDLGYGTTAKDKGKQVFKFKDKEQFNSLRKFRQNAKNYLTPSSKIPMIENEHMTAEKRYQLATASKNKGGNRNANSLVIKQILYMLANTNRDSFTPKDINTMLQVKFGRGIAKTSLPTQLSSLCDYGYLTLDLKYTAANCQNSYTLSTENRKCIEGARALVTDDLKVLCPEAFPASLLQLTLEKLEKVEEEKIFYTQLYWIAKVLNEANFKSSFNRQEVRKKLKRLRDSEDASIRVPNKDIVGNSLNTFCELGYLTKKNLVKDSHRICKYKLVRDLPADLAPLGVFITGLDKKRKKRVSYSASSKRKEREYSKEEDLKSDEKTEEQKHQPPKKRRKKTIILSDSESSAAEDPQDKGKDMLVTDNDVSWNGELMEKDLEDWLTPNSTITDLPFSLPLPFSPSNENKTLKKSKEKLEKDSEIEKLRREVEQLRGEKERLEKEKAALKSQPSSSASASPGSGSKRKRRSSKG